MSYSKPMSPQVPILDEFAALEALGGNRQLLNELAQIFVEDTPKILQEMNAAMITDDIEVARRSVHSLKGLSATFYSKPTTDLAKQLEEELRRGSLQCLRDGGAEQLAIAIDILGRELRRCCLAQ